MPPGGICPIPGGTPGIAAKAARAAPGAEASALAFQRLLMENVLPLAQRRTPDDITAVAGESETRAVMKLFAGGLADVFRTQLRTIVSCLAKLRSHRQTVLRSGMLVPELKKVS